MAKSVFELFSIGLGPSSSHTVGPMRAARRFILEAEAKGFFNKADKIVVDLYGSLALTGKGHATDLAIMLGLEGQTPEGIDPEKVKEYIVDIRRRGSLNILGRYQVPFAESSHLRFNGHYALPFHPNGMRFSLYGASDQLLSEQVFYSTGGGFIIDHAAAIGDPLQNSAGDQPALPYPFATAAELLGHAETLRGSIADVVLANELSLRPIAEVEAKLDAIWEVMRKCAERGCQIEGILPGGLGVKRRAPALYRQLQKQHEEGLHPPHSLLEWVSVWALAVNEENAAGSRVVTAPTNGAAGVLPAVIHYYQKFVPQANADGIRRFLLTAGAIAMLYKRGASISAAEMGCMGEVGVACSMAAGALTAVLGGTIYQVENAAEIGMEHHLGLTCDPVRGLVQIPCIERNTMGALKAINAAYLALRGDGSHRVSLDQVIATMRATGLDMKSHYKETSLGGLAVNVPEC